MKGIFTLSFLLLLVSSYTFAQKEIRVNIHHNLGDVSFELGKSSENNLSEKFTVERLQYYISEIVVIHDGGIETPVENMWVLVNATETFTFKLGVLNGVDNIEGLSYGIGVNEEVNHNDPSEWPLGHALYPASPSMHWGWSAGYRFIAMEGFSGDALNTIYQLHGLGDSNYFTNSIAVQGVEEDDIIYINIDADVNKALENINVMSGPISHGETGPAKAALENLRDEVFTASDITSGIDDFEVVDFNVYPNPSINGQFTVEVEDTNVSRLHVFNTDGRMLIDQSLSKQNTSITLNQSGFYFLNLVSNSGRTVSKKITVQ